MCCRQAAGMVPLHMLRERVEERGKYRGEDHAGSGEGGGEVAREGDEYRS